MIRCCSSLCLAVLIWHASTFRIRTFRIRSELNLSLEKHHNATVATAEEAISQPAQFLEKIMACKKGFLPDILRQACQPVSYVFSDRREKIALENMILALQNFGVHPGAAQKWILSKAHHYYFIGTHGTTLKSLESIKAGIKVEVNRSVSRATGHQLLGPGFYLVSTAWDVMAFQSANQRTYVGRAVAETRRYASLAQTAQNSPGVALIFGVRKDRLKQMRGAALTSDSCVYEFARAVKCQDSWNRRVLMEDDGIDFVLAPGISDIAAQIAARGDLAPNLEVVGHVMLPHGPLYDDTPEVKNPEMAADNGERRGRPGQNNQGQPHNMHNHWLNLKRNLAQAVGLG